MGDGDFVSPGDLLIITANLPQLVKKRQLMGPQYLTRDFLFPTDRRRSEGRGSAWLVFRPRAKGPFRCIPVTPLGSAGWDGHRPIRRIGSVEFCGDAPRVAKSESPEARGVAAALHARS